MPCTLPLGAQEATVTVTSMNNAQKNEASPRPRPVTVLVSEGPAESLCLAGVLRPHVARHFLWRVSVTQGILMQECLGDTALNFPALQKES